MRISAVPSRVSPLLIAVVLMFQLSPALATGEPDGREARRHGPVEVCFTKWRTVVVSPPTNPPPGTTTRSLFEGFVSGDLGDGEFVGEVLDRKASTACTAVNPVCTPGTPGTPTITTPTASLQAIYEVQAGEHSFIALIQGGSTSAGGRLEGVIVSGWRIGAHVRVAFDTLTSCTDRNGFTHGPCFDGTIRVGRAPEE